MSNVESQIVHALARTSPERIAVERAIYSAVERWTGVQIGLAPISPDTQAVAI